MRNKMKWEPARPLKRPDNILSSDFAHNTAPFIPSYDKSPHNMHMLLGMEYSRKWHEERNLWDRRVFPPAERSYFSRKYVMRGRRAKFPTKPPPAPFKMARFRNVPARTDHSRPQKAASAAATTTKPEEHAVPGKPSSSRGQCTCSSKDSNRKSGTCSTSKLSGIAEEPPSDSNEKTCMSRVDSKAKNSQTGRDILNENLEGSSSYKAVQSDQAVKSKESVQDQDKASRQSTSSRSSSISLSSVDTCINVSTPDKHEPSLTSPSVGSLDRRVCCRERRRKELET